MAERKATNQRDMAAPSPCPTAKLDRCGSETGKPSETIRLLEDWDYVASMKKVVA